MKKLLTLFLCLYSFQSFALWKKVTIPEAKCGDGKPYFILVQNGVDNKLLVEFMGGGVCWDKHSCFEKISLFPWLHTYPVVNSYSVFTADYSSINPFKEHSKIYFPYCTADVHLGTHKSTYGDRSIYHYGRKNILLAFNYLTKNHLFNFAQVNDLVVFGASAGGIASLVYGKKLESMVGSNATKTMIVDSPGLHFGKTFWNKFDLDMKDDFKTSFKDVGLEVDFKDGAVSKKMAPVLDQYLNWRVGFIFGLKDVVMSKVFGEISPEGHKNLILGPQGLPAIAKNYSNVAFWLKDTSMHTFFLSKYTASMKNTKNIEAHDFVFNLYENAYDFR